MKIVSKPFFFSHKKFLKIYLKPILLGRLLTFFINKNHLKKKTRVLLMSAFKKFINRQF